MGVMAVRFDSILSIQTLFLAKRRMVEYSEPRTAAQHGIVLRVEYPQVKMLPGLHQ